MVSLEGGGEDCFSFYPLEGIFPGFGEEGGLVLCRKEARYLPRAMAASRCKPKK